MTDAIIREAEPNDLPEIGRLWRELQDSSAAYEPRLTPNPQASAWFQSYLHDQLDNANCAVYVADLRAGSSATPSARSCSARPCKPRECGYIADLCVHAEFRGRGLGRRLYERLRAWFLSRGIESIEVQVVRANPASQTFWRKMGFTDFLTHPAQRFVGAALRAALSLKLENIMPTIAILPGDGIGPEIMHEGVKVLQAAAKKHDLHLDLHEALVGGAAYDATGHPLPPETLALAQRADAIYLGAVGGPKYDNIPDPNLRPERGALLPLRQKLGLYANLRPCVLYASLAAACPLRPDLVEGGFDILVVRELTGGLYFGQPKGWEGDRALDTCVYTRAEITRIAHVAFKAAEKRPHRRVLSVDKANVLETSRLWRETVTHVAREYRHVTLSHQLVDATAMDLVRRPQSFDVIVTENLFGDILSDEAAQLTGSLGMLPLGVPGRTPDRRRHVRPVRTVPRQRPRHRRHRPGQPPGHHPLRRAAPALLPRCRGRRL